MEPRAGAGEACRWCERRGDFKFRIPGDFQCRKNSLEVVGDNRKSILTFAFCTLPFAF